MTSQERYKAWAKDNVGMTLWVQKGPKNTDIEEIRMVIMGDDGNTAIIIIYEGQSGFSLYRYSKRQCLVIPMPNF